MLGINTFDSTSGLRRLEKDIYRKVSDDEDTLEYMELYDEDYDE